MKLQQVFAAVVAAREFNCFSDSGVGDDCRVRNFLDVQVAVSPSQHVLTYPCSEFRRRLNVLRHKDCGSAKVMHELIGLTQASADATKHSLSHFAGDKYLMALRFGFLVSRLGYPSELSKVW